MGNLCWDSLPHHVGLLEKKNWWALILFLSLSYKSKLKVEACHVAVRNTLEYVQFQSANININLELFTDHCDMKFLLHLKNFQNDIFSVYSRTMKLICSFIYWKIIY